MANDLLNELNRNLANAEEIGNVEWAAALKARIVGLEKATKVPTPAVAVPKVKPVKATAPKKSGARKKN